MKLITYKHEGIEKFGIAKEGGIVELTGKLDAMSIRELLEKDLINQLRNFEQEITTLPYEDIEFLPVITNPGKIFCAGVNYDEHRIETKRDVLENPTIFFRVADSQIGHNEPLLIPHESDRLDYEGEIAIVISKEGRRIKEEDAYNYIAGYSCYNDGSIRDYQLHSSQWGPGKNFTGTGAFGPWLVLADEIGEGEVLTVETRLNGEVMQKSDTTNLLFSIPRLIAYTSTFTTLRPGDVIVTGTPGGVGAKRQPPVFMKEGDVVEIEVGKIGILRNSIAKEV